MANAKKCDRCGEFYTDKPIALLEHDNEKFKYDFITLTYSWTVAYAHIGLCQRCLDEFSMWLNNKEDHSNDKN